MLFFKQVNLPTIVSNKQQVQSTQHKTSSDDHTIQSYQQNKPEEIAMKRTRSFHSKLSDNLTVNTANALVSTQNTQLPVKLRAPKAPNVSSSRNSFGN